MSREFACDRVARESEVQGTETLFRTALFAEIVDHLAVLPLPGESQGRLPRVGTRADVRALLHQHRNGVELSLHRGQMQGRTAVRQFPARCARTVLGGCPK